jgi:tRNA (guanine-N7-)-methyltransferase
MKKSRIRQHVNPLSMRYITFLPDSVALTRDVIEVELGCAEGEFLFRRAEQFPQHHIIGIEIREDLVEYINDEALRIPDNQLITALFANLNHHLPLIFENNSVDRFFLNFPDPWFKKVHHKRRVISEKLVSEIIAALKPGGELFFQSDIFELAIDAMATLEEHGTPEFKNTMGEWTFLKDNPFGAPTRRENAVSRKGGKIWRMLYTL